MFKFLKKRKEIEIYQMVDDIYSKYVSIKSNSEFSDLEIIRNILLNRYKKNQSYLELAESNQDFLTDVQSLIYCITNIELPEGRDINELSDIHYISLKRLAKLGHQESKNEIENLDKLIAKAKSYNKIVRDEIRFSIQSNMHKRENFDHILSKLYQHE